MTEQIIQIAARLRGLREDIGLSSEDFAKSCQLDPEKYTVYEQGKSDIPISALHSIAKYTNVELSTLLSGDEPHVNAYAVTRKNQGLKLERRKAYSYQALGATFQHRRAEPFIVTVEPKNETPTLNTHSGQEFNLILKGSLKLIIGNKEITLNEGDSIYFDPQTPHGMLALNNESCIFLATIIA